MIVTSREVTDRKKLILKKILHLSYMRVISLGMTAINFNQLVAGPPKHAIISYYMNHYLTALHLLPRCTHKRLLKLYQKEPDFEKLWAASSQEYIKWGIEEEVAYGFQEAKKKIDLGKIAKTLEKQNIEIIHLYDPHYPFLLKQISDAPFVLYVKGNKNALQEKCLAIVGTRNISEYGKQVIRHIIPDLVRDNISIVSGLALGVDGYAHEQTLIHHGTAIGVLGSGIDLVRPLENHHLAHKIIEKNGCLLSDFPLGMEATPYSFPMRNRIISGLSRGVIIIEAKQKSGSLITAQLALEQNREVFAIPGSIFHEQSQGTNDLIAQGHAQLIRSAKDIQKYLGWENGDKQITPSKNKAFPKFKNTQEECIFACIHTQGITTDELVRKNNISLQETQSILTLFELQGWIKKISGDQWVKTF